MVNLLDFALIMYFWIQFSLLSLSAHAASVNRPARSDNCSVSAAQIRSQLGSQLSAETNIIDAGHGDLQEATQRWQDYNNPPFISIVEVATVEDIVKTVRY